ncbi:MAG: helix-hairpin-helix domain-containing protein [Deltaproteobacteria bacterium]|nr:helix-hairpin-helix domain-containing protein [Deltaproteobacteria bacterium]
MPHIENDARVEILLFLGIVFWCWMLVLFFQGRFAVSPESPLTLSWNGKALQMVTKPVVLRSGEQLQIVPAALTPFFFQPIPVNFADQELLSTISGIGPELAAQIVKTRDSKGLFAKPEDLLAVPGIGRSRMNQFAPQFSFAVSQ